jgi:hypothetical protein
MLNRTPRTAPSAEDLAAEDRRIEVAAARETALTLAARAVGAGAYEIINMAALFETFLLDHQSNGQQALEITLGMIERRLNYAPINEIMETATRFCGYLDKGSPNAA